MHGPPTGGSGESRRKRRLRQRRCRGVEDDAVDAEMQPTAKTVAGHRKLSVVATWETVLMVKRGFLGNGLTFELRPFQSTTATKGVWEGIAAFVERGRPMVRDLSAR